MDWINIKTRLPDNENPVLVAVYRYGQSQGVCIGEYSHFFHKWYDSAARARGEYFSSFGHLNGEVLYWQPLPTPPDHENL